MSMGPNGENLVFLLSLPRSGSTLFSLMLDRHPAVRCPQEPWLLFALLSCRNRPAADPVGYHARIGMRGFLPENRFLELTRGYALEAYKAALCATGKHIFVDKTPLYAWYLEEIHRMFPEAAYIWLQRNPLDVATSYMTSWYTTPHELPNHPHNLKKCCENLIGLFDSGPKRALEIRYEDLVTTPRDVLRSVCAFLGIAFEPDMLTYDRDLAKRFSLGDSKAAHHEQVHTGSIGAWRRFLDNDQLAVLRRLFPDGLMARFGYRPPASDTFADRESYDRAELARPAAERAPWQHKELSFVYLHEAYIKMSWRFLGTQHTTACLLGGGAYAEWLLRITQDVPGGPRITMILDDDAQRMKEFHGVPVVRPDAIRSLPADVIVLGTDDPASALHHRARQLFGDRLVIDLYDQLNGIPYPKGNQFDRSACLVGG